MKHIFYLPLNMKCDWISGFHYQVYFAKISYLVTMVVVTSSFVFGAYIPKYLITGPHLTAQHVQIALRWCFRLAVFPIEAGTASFIHFLGGELLFLNSYVIVAK